MKVRALSLKRLLVLAVGPFLWLLGWLALPQQSVAQSGCTPREWVGRSAGPPFYFCNGPSHVDCSGVIIWCPPLY